MPRTVEHIVGCHHIAAARRAVGRPIWDMEIDVKAILRIDQTNESTEHVAEMSKKIAALLRARLPKKVLDFMDAEHYEGDLDGAIDDMEVCTVDSLNEDAHAPNGVEPVEMLNGWLEVIYDWADGNRVWLGN